MNLATGPGLLIIKLQNESTSNFLLIMALAINLSVALFSFTNISASLSPTVSPSVAFVPTTFHYTAFKPLSD